MYLSCHKSTILNMTGYFISRNDKSLFNATDKVKTDCESILTEMVFKNLGFKQSLIPNSAISVVKNFFDITYALLSLQYKVAISSFITDNNIGFTIGNHEELNDLLENISPEE
ncbi:hypothetical protein [Aquimarina aquimarini]|uniref:hypothetical protein n=1 Tax=Aquimarina aquimarini TaxID=1191734 RepID=UPI001F3583EF|nr:hypothetical protein [Aquimarina aquimarini]